MRTWAVIGEEVYSVNAVARYLSSWPDGTRSQLALTMGTDGGEAVEAGAEAPAG